MDSALAEYIARWNLASDGAPIVRHGSRLLPVRRDGVAAMLKVAVAEEEKSGALLMSWWRGRGAARVLAREGNALLLERAEGARSLAALVRTGKDDEATRIVCSVIAELHAPREHPPSDLVSLGQWFRPLERGAARHGGVLTLCAEVARELLSTPQDVDASRGWLAIDPKGLRGERGFDYANLLCNPDREIAVAPGRLARQLDVAADAARLERTRLLRWVFAYAGLSAVWAFDDALVPELDLSIVTTAATELTRDA